MTSPHNEIDTLRASLGAITTPAMFRMGLRDAIIERVFDDIDPSEDTANPEVDWLTAEQCADQVLDAIHAHYEPIIADLRGSNAALVARIAAMSETPAGPFCWVLPGEDTANKDGWIEARIDQDGEFSKPLYERHTCDRSTSEPTSRR